MRQRPDNPRQYDPSMESTTSEAGRSRRKKIGHSRGITIDLTIAGLAMGSPLDLFDPISNTNSDQISDKAKKNHQNQVQIMDVGA